MTLYHTVEFTKAVLKGTWKKNLWCRCLQVSISGQALVFVVRTSNWSIISRAGMYTYIAFFAAQVSFHLLFCARFTDDDLS